MEYLTDKITDAEIDGFGEKEYVIINSPTGSGKTTFVLKCLLPRAVAEGKHIVFICNRSILRDQIEVSAKESQRLFFSRLATLTEQESDLIHIFTYQYCEAQGNLKKINISDTDIILTPENVMYYIFDEAHYFLNDSLFNQGTHYWTEEGRFGDLGIKIFMTATPEPLVWFLSAVIPRNMEWLPRLTDKDYKSEISISNLYKMICDKVEEKDERKKTLKNEQVKLEHLVSFNKDGTSKREERTRVNRRYTNRYISEKCREIEIFSGTLEAMQEQIEKGQSRCSIYPSEAFQTNYNEFIEFYYASDKDLIAPIKETPETEKWLVFVSDSDKGYALKSALSALEISAVFLSRRTVTKQAEVKKQYDQIVNKGKFSCRVLIATSVMDCGVSITDSAVKHVAISQSDKVTFLQMLGRRRLVDGDSVCLYIKAFSAKQLYGIKYKYEGKAILMSQYGLINDPKVKFSRPTNYDDCTRFRDHFSQEKVNKISNEITQGDNNALTYIVRGESKRDSSAEVTEIRANNITAFIALLYLINELTAAMDEYESSGDPFFYLRRQLGWIGKTYDERRWLTLRATMAELNAFFEEYLDKTLNKEEQKEFSLAFFEIAMFLPTPPSVFKANRSRYTRQNDQPQKYPGLNRVNRALEELGLPFFVGTKCLKKKTVWILTRKEDSE